MRKRLTRILCSLLLTCITICSMGQTLLDGQKIHYITNQDSIRITYGTDNKLFVTMPEYTYRKTIFAVRAGRTCIVEKTELSRQLVSTQQEMQIQKMHTVNTTVEVNVEREQNYQQRVQYDAEKIQLRSTYDKNALNLTNKIGVLTQTVKEQKRRGVKGFLIGFGVGIFTTITTAIVIAK